MSEDVDNLNSRLERALARGNIEECRQLMSEGAGSPATLSQCKQASWLKSAISAPRANHELLDMLLNAGFDPSSVYDQLGEDYQSTPLITAAKAGRLDLVEKLASAGANIHWHSPTGTNAASEILPSLSPQAPRPDTPELATVREWLTQRGVKIDPLCSDSRRKLYWAASNPCSWPNVPQLLRLGMDAAVLGWTPFMIKLADGNANIGDVDTMPAEEIQHRDTHQRTPFLMAVAAGRLDLLQTLLARGSDLHARSRCGASALHLAARYEHCHIIKWLVSLGIPIEIENEFHNTPLRDAVSYGKVDATRQLLEYGANCRASDDNGYRVIHEARSREMLSLLIQAGAEVNDVSGGGDWPLKEACFAGDLDLVAFLLKQGVNPNLTSTGETALFSAVRSDSIECVTLLLDAGAEINAVDCDGWTCLWNVDSLPMAHLLLMRGADPSISDQCGGLPEDCYMQLAVSNLFKEARIQKQKCAI